MHQWVHHIPPRLTLHELVMRFGTGSSHSFCLFCRREARRYHGAAVHCGWIHRLKSMCESVCVLFWGWSFLPVCLSLPPAALPNALHPVGWQGRPTNTTHTPHFCTHVHFVFFILFCFWCLERLRGSRQLGHFSCWSWRRRRGVWWAGGMPFSLLCLIARHQHFLGGVTDTWGLVWLTRNEAEGLKIWLSLCINRWDCKRSKPWFGILLSVVIVWERNVRVGFEECERWKS